jgi:hypothetical protein
LSGSFSFSFLPCRDEFIFSMGGVAGAELPVAHSAVTVCCDWACAVRGGLSADKPAMDEGRWAQL